MYKIVKDLVSLSPLGRETLVVWQLKGSSQLFFPSVLFLKVMYKIVKGLVSLRDSGSFAVEGFFPTCGSLLEDTSITP